MVLSIYSNDGTQLSQTSIARNSGNNVISIPATAGYGVVDYTARHSGNNGHAATANHTFTIVCSK